MADTHVNELLNASSFVLIMDDNKVASFQEVSGMESETDVIELMQSTKDGKKVIIKSQGATTLKAGKITAKYAAFKDDQVLKWRQDVIDGNMAKARRNCSIVVYSADDKEVFRFNLLNAWPSKYSWSSLSAKSNEPLQITVVIEHEQLTIGK